MATYTQEARGVVGWWLADFDRAEAVSFGHETHHHRIYVLTCGQYERLLQRANDRCEVCELPARDNFGGKLHIDHDNELGQWAVRGLLCRTCNTTIRFPWMAKRAAEYEGRAFYRLLLAERGVTRDLPPEPAIGCVVRDHARRPWQRTTSGWEPRHPRSMPTPAQPWDRLVYRYGPHNLRVVAELSRAVDTR